MHLRSLKFPFIELLDAVTDGSGGGAAAGQDGSNAGSQSAGNNGQSSAQQDASRTGATPPGKYSFDEDRKDWTPPYRLKEETAKRQETERKIAAYEAQVKERDAKIAALAGVTQPDPSAKKAEDVKAAFFEMFPQFKRLSDLPEEKFARLLQSPDDLDSVREFKNQQARAHGDRLMGSLYSKAADSLGADKLSDDQQHDLREGFAAWFTKKVNEEAKASGGAESETLNRYERGDDALLDDYVKRFRGNWIEPASRKATASNLTRIRPVVNSKGQAQTSTVNRPEKFKTLDERLDYAAKLAKERGASFNS